MLDAGDDGVLDLVGFAVLAESSIDLACAENDAFDVLRCFNGLVVLGLRDDPIEVLLANKVLERGAGKRMTKKRLGEEEDESWE